MVMCMDAQHARDVFTRPIYIVNMTTPASLPVKLQPSNIRPIAYRILSKKHGLNIQSDALAVLTDTISTKFGPEWRGAKAQQFMEEIAKLWKQQDRGLFVDGRGLSLVIKELADDKSVGSAVLNEAAKATRSDTLVDTGAAIAVGEELNWADFFKFVTPDVQPNFVFDRTRMQFTLQPPAGAKLTSTLRASIEYFNQRFFLILNRLSRDDNFQKASFSSIAAIHTSLQNSSAITYEITLIKNVLGRDGNRFVMFGLLSKNANGNYILEDSSDHIELNLTQTYKTEGSFYSTGMMVIVDGIYSASGGSMSNDANVISGCFHVSNIAQPPAEKRDASMEAYGNLDFMGIHSEVHTKYSSVLKIDKLLKKKLSMLEKTLVDHKLILLGCNVHLDDPKVLTGLKKFFTTLEENLEDQHDVTSDEKHRVIVMTGSFVSQSLTSTNASVSSISSSEDYKNNFDNFAEMLSNFPLVVKCCRFVLIPGPNDPWQSTFSYGKSSSTVLPQAPVPKVFLTRLERLLPKGSLILGWNPMRINYVSQEIVLYRDDLMNKLKRNDIVFEHDLEVERALLEKVETGEDQNVENILSDEVHLSSKIKQARKLVKTILDQATLQPFLRDLKVVNPNYQAAMRLEPLPTTLMLFDSRFECFEVTYNGCKVANMGNLISNQNARCINYAEYSPSNKKYAFKQSYF